MISDSVSLRVREGESRLIMEGKRCGVGGLCRKFKAHFLMILVQLGYSIVTFITEASFEHGLNPYVYVTYRSIAAGLALLPFAFFLERYVLTYTSSLYVLMQ